MLYMLNEKEHEEFSECKKSAAYLEQIKTNAVELVKEEKQCLREDGHSYCDGCILGRISWRLHDKGQCLAGLEMRYSK